MSKIVAMKDIGIPVPTPAPNSADHLIVYYGSAGFTPDYAQTARIDAGAVSALTTKTVNGVAYYDDPIGSELPVSVTDGTYDFYFTLEDPATGSEGDFSPVIQATVTRTVPPTLGQPIELT
jgi:hypothetical protein